MRTSYENYWKNNIGDMADRNGKLSTYRKFKSSFRKEKYLDVIRDAKNRKAMSTFRISAHRLEIKSYRYQKISPGMNVSARCAHQIIRSILATNFMQWWCASNLNEVEIIHLKCFIMDVNIGREWTWKLNFVCHVIWRTVVQWYGYLHTWSVVCE